MYGAHHERPRLARAFAAGLGAAAIGVLLAAAPALGAGTGYGGAGGTSGSGGTGGLAGTVVSTTTVQPTGGPASGVVGSDTVTVTVPSGAFANPVQVVVTNAAGDTPTTVGGSAVALSFGVGFYQNGTKVTGTFPAVACSVSGPNVNASSVLYLNGSSTPYPTTFVAPDTLDFTVTSDPNFLLTTAATTAALSSTSASAVAGATTAQTGVPLRGELLLAGVLVMAGGSLLVVRRMRRRSA